jgi:uncharacterized protein YbgA (DUF1722 family)/uncharacterized protein YbbK (DUF523 family)
MSSNKLRIGVSSCLLGQRVRYDGQHKRDNFLVDRLGEHAEWVPVCPEFELGLGVPRPTLRLEGNADDQRLVMPSTGEDYTDAMLAYAEKRVAAIADLKLDGYVLKSKSPSCGMERVKLYPREGQKGPGSKTGVGTFAAVLKKKLPNLPLEEEGRLNDPPLRENFVSRIFAFHRWQNLVASGVTRKSLTDFHAAHKYQLMAHNQTGMRRMGQLLANPDAFPNDQALADAYLEEYTAIMRRTPTVRKHTNVLQHIAGYFTKKIDAEDRAELAEVILDYNRGLLPLIVPITLLRHHLRRHPLDYLTNQVYLFPHPHELTLLNSL